MSYQKQSADEAHRSAHSERGADRSDQAGYNEAALREELQRTHLHLDHLQLLSAALADAHSPQDVAVIALTQVAAALQASSGLFVLVRHAERELEIQAEFGYPPALIDRWRTSSLSAATPIADCARAQTPILIGTLAEAVARYPQLQAARASSDDMAWANIPLVRHARSIGVLALGFRESQEFPADVQAFLLALAQQCAQALERALLYETEHQARTSAEHAIRIRDHVIALLSHDLKNPLTTVLGRTALVQRHVDSEQALERSKISRNLAAIRQAATQMLNQIDELLDNTRVQAGEEVALKIEPIDIAAMLRNLVSLIAQSDQQRVILSGAETARVYHCDKLRIERVILNLLNNAAKYSPPGGNIFIHLQECRSQTSNWLQLRMTDEGIGIPLDEQQRIFEPFYRASNGSGHAGGTGLGLASAHQVIRQHGGTLTVESAVGQGSTFVINLPL